MTSMRDQKWSTKKGCWVPVRWYERLIPFVLFGACLPVFVGLILGLCVGLGEAGCNQRAAELHVVDGDYRLLSDTCYLTLSDGTVIPADQYRATQEVER